MEDFFLPPEESTYIGPARLVGQLRTVYDVTINDEEIITTVTSKRNVVRNWLAAVNRRCPNLPGCRIVGLDATAFHDRPIGTIQICVDRTCLVFRIPLADSPVIPFSLVLFLQNQTNLFVGINMRANIMNLRKYNGNRLRTVRFMDIGREAATWYVQPRLETAKLRLLGQVVLMQDFYTVPPEYLSGDWNGDTLTDWQVLQATIDAYASYKIGCTLYVVGQVAQAGLAIN